MSGIAIRIENLGKRYALGTRRESYSTLRDTLSRLLAAPFRRLSRGGISARGSDPEFVWALRNVSFDVQSGEAVGIIGRNGAGKSTLLKILSRITEPTEGFADIYGRVGSLIEVGTGFHAELTGRENIYLAGAILGMKKAEIDRTFDDIVAFAEVEQFIDTPVKRYSSGMYVRLAFGVAAHMDPQILIVDEVLAVGDAEFQRKCIGKISDVAKGGRTVLFVSHNMAAVRRLCSRAILLEHGRIAAEGTVDEVVSQYLEQGMSSPAANAFNPRNRRGTGWARIVGIRLLDRHDRVVDALPCDADLRFEVDVAVCDPGATRVSLRGLVLELLISSALGQPLVSLMNVDDTGVELPAESACRLQVTLPGPTFVPGRYSLNIALGTPFIQDVDKVPDALRFDILPPQKPWRPYDLSESMGLFCRKADWRCVSSTAAAQQPSLAATPR